MDWSKAKNILILALLATNIFLLFTYITKNETDSSITDHDVLYAVLEGKNIFIDTEIAGGVEKMPAITITYNRGRQKIIEENLESGRYDVSADGELEEYHRAADAFLQDCKVDSESLIFDKVIQEDKKFIVRYNNCYRSIPIGGSFMDVTFEDGKLLDMTRQFVTAEPKSKKKLEVISPEEALLMFMSQKSREEVIHVENMELVFWVNDSNFDGESLISDTAFPAWQITYNEGKIKYIDAYRA